jgi:hypothetical protein
MALSFQQQSRRRKLAYAGVIVLLFTAMLIHRREMLHAAAEKHNLQETDLGQVDLGGSAARFTLASFRGPLICILWREAIEHQKRHEWNQLRLVLESLAKLQPHFTSVWEFQGWNLAYNVAVEFDRVPDKYHYVAEGIQWLAKGERITRHRVYDPSRGEKIEVGDPELRLYIGFMFHHKMTTSDEARIYHCFLHLSCIPPHRWDPVRLRQDPEELERFKQDYPHLIRRFREMKSIPEGAEAQLNRELLSFFEAHRQLPSRYQYAGRPVTEDSPDAKRFPLWPREGEPKVGEFPLEVNTEREENQNPFEITMAWYRFAQEPLPPPGQPLPPRTDRRYRLPRKTLLLFRHQVPLCRSLQAMHFAKDGWFVESRAAWEEADRLWQKYGRENGLELDEAEFARLNALAEQFRQRYPEYARRNERPPQYLPDQEFITAGYQAHQRLGEIMARRYQHNYVYWKDAAAANKYPRAIDARRHFYNASRRLRSDLTLARAEYELGLAAWRDVLIAPHQLLALGPYSGLPAAWAIPHLHTPFGAHSQTQQEVSELEAEYMRHRARCESVLHLRLAGLRELACLLGSQSASPGGFGPAGCLPAGCTLVPVGAVEDALEALPGPLQPYLERATRPQEGGPTAQAPDAGGAPAGSAPAGPTAPYPGGAAVPIKP